MTDPFADDERTFRGVSVSYDLSSIPNFGGVPTDAVQRLLSHFSSAFRGVDDSASEVHLPTPVALAVASDFARRDVFSRGPYGDAISPRRGLTAKGETFSYASGKKKMEKAEAWKCLDDFLERCTVHQNEPDRLVDIDAVWLFGSMLVDDVTHVGDVDIAIDFSPHANLERRMQEYRDEERRVYGDGDGLPPEFRKGLENFIEASRKSKMEFAVSDLVYRHVFEGMRCPAFEEMETFLGLHVPCRRVFTKATGREIEPILPHHPRSTGRNPEYLVPDHSLDLSPLSEPAALAIHLVHKVDLRRLHSPNGKRKVRWGDPQYLTRRGDFEKVAEGGLVRPDGALVDPGDMSFAIDDFLLVRRLPGRSGVHCLLGSVRWSYAYSRLDDDVWRADMSFAIEVDETAEELEDASLSGFVLIMASGALQTVARFSSAKSVEVVVRSMDAGSDRHVDAALGRVEAVPTDVLDGPSPHPGPFQVLEPIHDGNVSFVDHEGRVLGSAHVRDGRVEVSRRVSRMT